MSTKLIAHLKKKCEEDGNVAILFAQWEFDQKLVGKALENIGGFYPHFSNHNASHSQQILVNIERLLGDDIELLTATDTWLILEASYWHDVGMLVDAKNAKEVHSNPDFNFMIQTIANEKGHDLQKFCQAYVEKNWLSAIGTVDHPFDGIEQYRQLVAEWFRRGHDKRVGKIVEDPFKDLGITSPRTELLPNRIYRYLGQICVSHGMNFDTLMETIPYKQTGLGTEDCHPRFIGCLLRLGDLFDLDDNRFCPVMAKHVSNIPSVSKHHHDKHLSLREFQLDKRTVKLVAECPDEMSYVETQNWFGWIREEFQNQMSQWNLIVPSLKFGSLPTIEQLDVKMQGNKVLLSNKPMKFSIDESNALEILEGSGLYKNDINIFRELIQNAIDATLIQVWCDYEKGKIKLPKKSHPFDNKTQSALNGYAINLSFERIEIIEGSDDAWWEFRIEDKGTGVSLQDLNYMQKVAGSSRNIERQKIINRMPKWMRPSGQFGIGLHSAFLLLKDLNEDEQKITIISTNSSDYKTYKIELNSPLNSKRGYCFIEEQKDVKKDIGTTIILKFKKKRRARSYSFNSSKLYQFLYADHDPLKEEMFDIFNVATQIEGIKSDVLEKICFPYEFNENWQTKINDILPPHEISLKNAIWVEKYNLYFEINGLNRSNLNKLNGNLHGGFKGQNVGSISYYQQMFDIYLMFFGFEAKNTLQTNRNEWNKGFENKFIDDKFLHELSRHILENYKNELDNILKDEGLVELFEFYFNEDKSKNKWKNIELFCAEDLVNYKYKNDKCQIYAKSFSELINLKQFNFYHVDRFINSGFDVSTLSEYDLVYPDSFNGWFKNIFDQDWIDKGGFIFNEKINGVDVVRYTKEKYEGINESEISILNQIKRAIQSDRKRINFNEEWLSYNFFNGYEPLFTKSILVERLVGLEHLNVRHLILPFYIFSKDLGKSPNFRIDYLDNNDLVKFTWKARSDEYEDKSLEFYQKLYQELEKKIIDLIQAVYPDWIQT
ncbi:MULTISPECIES: HD domain-containing protein [Acinetobacter]|uniref:HD domain-containing protein n=1 Tax=Acinetobacter TaxID=469 RepID=UPI000EA3C476|nr:MULTISPECIES: ATP-binding protein [Acinetobacter]RKG42479.1 ATP-binding protein [Acinetobacter cumulans]RZG58355.1 ATP-binding protein [Acinetobacter sp. WCHAc060006]